MVRLLGVAGLARHQTHPPPGPPPPIPRASVAGQFRGAYLVALQTRALVPGRQQLATRRVAEIRAVRRDGQPARRVGRMAGEAALLTVAGDARADVALRGQRMAVRTRRGNHGATRVADPARGVERLESGAGAEGVVGPPSGQAALGIGGDPEALVAADAERLQAVAGRAGGNRAGPRG